MKFVSKFKENLKLNINHYINSIIINQIDSNTKNEDLISKKNLSVQDLNRLNSSGFLYFEKFLPEELNQLIIFNFNNEKSIFTKNLLKVFKFVEDNFYEIIKNYIGGEVVLSGYDISIIKKGTVSVSGSWHTDDLGKKINLFLCVEGNGTMPTAFIPGSHKKKYNPNLLINFRHFNVKNFKKNQNEILLKYKKNDCAMFDSNGLHRGIYEKETTKDRIVLQMQFLDIQKVYQLGFKKTPKLFMYKNTKPIFRDKKENEKLLIDNSLINDYLKFNFIKKEFIKCVGNKFYYYFS